MRYGFVGLGNLGFHLASSLRRGGFDLTVTDLSRAAAEPLLAEGARWAPDARSLAAGCDAVFTCLPNPKASGRGGAAGRGLKAKGVETLECPVTGGVHRAAAGKITLLLGGDKAAFERLEPALKVMGGEILHMGPLGSAAVIKVITNMLAFIHLVADGEALMLAKRGGLDLGQAWRAIKASSGNSFVHETEGQLILNGSYDIAFTNALAQKDLGFALDFGRKFGVPLKLAGLVEQIFQEATAVYGKEAQSTQVVKLLEDALGTDLRAPGFPARLDPA